MPALEAVAEGDGSKEQQDAEFLYNVPVDSECKAQKIKLFSLAAPHMRAFHIAWVNFFMTFTATFAPAALTPVIREDMSLTKSELGTANTCAVLGAIFGRIGMGVLLETVGPRFGSAFIMLTFAVPTFLIALVHNGATFAALRFFIGLSLSCFVCCQQWVGSMFNVKIVGTANAITAGWGNMGGGVTQIVMPAIYEGIRNGGAVPAFEAWRWAFMVPGGIFILMGLVTLVFGWDHPKGDFRKLKQRGELPTSPGSVWKLLRVAVCNYRTWILMLNYGYCFGVELTVDNIIVGYLYDKYKMDLVTAGGLGALFGMMNLFTRPSGGMLSDAIAIPWGIRGRLWLYFCLQFLGGVFCLALGRTTTLAATIAIMIVFSIFCQQACGAAYGVVPFVSRRAYGVVAGIVGAGGNLGAVITSVIFFGGSPSSPDMTIDDGLTWLGVMIMGVTLTLALVHFPMWGSMFCPGDGTTSEEDYYLREWDDDEVSAGLHATAMSFAAESRLAHSRRSAMAPGTASGLSKGAAVSTGDVRVDCDASRPHTPLNDTTDAHQHNNPSSASGSCSSPGNKNASLAAMLPSPRNDASATNGRPDSTM